MTELRTTKNERTAELPDGYRRTALGSLPEKLWVVRLEKWLLLRETEEEHAKADRALDEVLRTFGLVLERNGS